MSWLPYALTLPLFAALMPIISEHFKVNAVQLVLIYRFFVIIAFFPVLFLMDAPTDPLFYVYVCIAGIIALYFDTMFFSSASISGAGVTARVMPLVILFGFILWLIITPSLLISYIKEPLRGLGILTSITLATYFALRLKSCPISARTLKMLMPAILLGSCVIVLGKLAMMHTTVTDGPFFYVIIQSLFILPLYYFTTAHTKVGAYLPCDNKLPIFTPRLLMAGTCMSTVWSLFMLAKYKGYALAENPAYVSLFELLAPILISGYYILKHQK